MLQKSPILKSRGRQKTRWSLSTEKEQMELWKFERQILQQVTCERTMQIIRLRWKHTAFEIILRQWQEAA